MEKHIFVNDILISTGIHRYIKYDESRIIKRINLRKLAEGFKVVYHGDLFSNDIECDFLHDADKARRVVTLLNQSLTHRNVIVEKYVHAHYSAILEDARVNCDEKAFKDFKSAILPTVADACVTATDHTQNMINKLENADIGSEEGRRNIASDYYEYHESFKSAMNTVDAFIKLLLVQFKVSTEAVAKQLRTSLIKYEKGKKSLFTREDEDNQTWIKIPYVEDGDISCNHGADCMDKYLTKLYAEHLKTL